MAALRQAGIKFEIVPGITAAVAASAQAQIPLTDREGSSGIIFLTAQPARGKGRSNIARFASADMTLAIYMPSGRFGEIATEVMAAGLSPQTPCLIVSNASRADQHLTWTELANMHRLSPPEPPALLIIGSVARCREEMLAAPMAISSEFRTALEAVR